jgi:hypothetical protein
MGVHNASVSKKMKPLYSYLFCSTCKEKTKHIWCLSKYNTADSWHMIYACMECGTEHQEQEATHGG